MEHGGDVANRGGFVFRHARKITMPQSDFQIEAGLASCLGAFRGAIFF